MRDSLHSEPLTFSTSYMIIPTTPKGFIIIAEQNILSNPEEIPAKWQIMCAF